MIISIVEIQGRSDQGVTKPFICLGEDGKIYFVKGRGAGRRSLVCEWIAGHLAQRLGMPTALFSTVEIPASLISLGSRDDLSELGAGFAFGSVRKDALLELSPSQLPRISAIDQRDVLAFDWWIRNGDRTLGISGGNPNLFWDVAEERLVILDHNQAFDRDFGPAEFVTTHAFKGQCKNLFEDWEIQEQLAIRFLAAMDAWDEICNTMPSAWRFIDEEQTLPVDFDFETEKQNLLDCRGDAFWNPK